MPPLGRQLQHAVTYTPTAARPRENVHDIVQTPVALSRARQQRARFFFTSENVKNKKTFNPNARVFYIIYRENYFNCFYLFGFFSSFLVRCFAYLFLITFWQRRRRSAPRA